MRYGVLDLGGEALSLAVVEPTPDGGFHTRQRETIVLGLARAEGRPSCPPGMVELAVETLRRLVALAERAGCQEVRATLRASLAPTPAGATLAAHVRELVHGPVELLTAEDERAMIRSASAGTDATVSASVADAIVRRAVTAPASRAAAPGVPAAS